MFEEMIKRAIANALQAVKEEREREANLLMEEIDLFHKQNAIEKALETNDKEAFLILTGGTSNVHQ